MLAYYAHGKGFRTSLVTATRGEGGQNEIGPELFEALAVLRTEELLAAHRFDGAEQYFTRAVDFGYSFSIDETLEKWGKQEILGDYVRMIRTIRPDVIVGFVFDGAGGGQHHQTSSRLTPRRFARRPIPRRSPSRFRRKACGRGRRRSSITPPASAARARRPGRGGRAAAAEPRRGGRRGCSSPAKRDAAAAFSGGDAYDPVLGRTYAEIAGEARSMHKCQGMSQLLPLPRRRQGSAARGYRLRDTVLSDGVNRSESDLFDGIDTRITSLAAFAGAQPPPALTSPLERIATAAAEARTALAGRRQRRDRAGARRAG